MAELVIKPVAWSGGVVTKYRASVEFEDSSVISGDPKTTEEDAVRSLGDECKAWDKRVTKAKALVKKYLKIDVLR
jgi:hypothetical protein